MSEHANRTILARSLTSTHLSIGTKIAILTCAVAVLAAAAVGLTTYWQFHRSLVELELEELGTLAQVKAWRFTNVFEIMQADARFLAHSPVVQRLLRAQQSGGVDPVSGEAEAALMERSGLVFYELLWGRRPYYQVRLVSTDGQEIVRVERSTIEGDPEITPKHELQDGIDEAYCNAALRLPDDEVFLSDIVLNRERGLLADPPLPVLRAAAPVYGPDDKPVAVLVLSRFFAPLVEDMHFGLDERHTLFVANDQGEYLVHPDPKLPFAHERGSSRPVQGDFASLRPVFEADVAQNMSLVDTSSGGGKTAIGICSVPLDATNSSRFIVVALAASYADVVAESVHSRNRSLIAGALVVLVAVVAASILSQSVTRPLRQIAAAATAFGRGDANVALPIQASDETGIVARSLESMMTEVQAAHADLVRRAEEIEQSRRSALNLLQDVEANRQLAVRAEQHARDQSAKTQAVLETATDAIITIATDGKVESFNAAAEGIFGYKAGEVIGKNVNMLMPPPFHDEHDQYLRNYLETGVSKIIGIGREVVGRRADGSTFPLDLAVSEVKLGDRRTFTGIVRDITERKRAIEQLTEANDELARRASQIERFNRELSRSNDELKQFAYVASHDLQEPLRKVTAFCQILNDEYAERLDDDARTYIQYAVDGAMRMRTLIQDLLVYSRVETQGKPMEPTDAAGAYAEAIENLAVAIAESGAEVTCDPLPVVPADRAQLARLFQNLIGNAIKYRGQEAPRIDVRVDEGPQEWTFCVRDNGIGIDARYFERIFVIFQRLHAREQYSGTGIGLAVCRRIVERAGGRIWVESKVGEGSAFYFTIPKRGPHAQHNRNRDVAEPRHQYAAAAAN